MSLGGWFGKQLVGKVREQAKQQSFQFQIEEDIKFFWEGQVWALLSEEWGREMYRTNGNMPPDGKLWKNNNASTKIARKVFDLIGRFEQKERKSPNSIFMYHAAKECPFLYQLRIFTWSLKLWIFFLIKWKRLWPKRNLFYCLRHLQKYVPKLRSSLDGTIALLISFLSWRNSKTDKVREAFHTKKRGNFGLDPKWI